MNLLITRVPLVICHLFISDASCQIRVSVDNDECIFSLNRVHWKGSRNYRDVHIDFIETFDKVNHQGILFKLCSMGIWIFMLSVLSQLVSRSQYVGRGGCFSEQTGQRWVVSFSELCFGTLVIHLVRRGAFLYNIE